jgi:hypothetical protein
VSTAVSITVKLKEKLVEQFKQVKISKNELAKAQLQMQEELIQKWDESVRQGTLTEGESLRTPDLFARTCKD